jgi:hypothetical protein
MKKHLSLRLPAFFFYQRHMPGCGKLCHAECLNLVDSKGEMTLSKEGRLP